MSQRPTQRERSKQREVELQWARKSSREFCLNANFHVTFRVLLHAANVRHGTAGFTSPRKEGMLGTSLPWKNGQLRLGLNPGTWVLEANTHPLRPPKPLSTLQLLPFLFSCVLDLYISLLPYILESNPHPFYSFRGLKNQMWIRIACGLDSRSRAGFWKNDRAVVRAVSTIKYNNLLFYLLFITHTAR
jgi:hypothetical protein